VIGLGRNFAEAVGDIDVSEEDEVLEPSWERCDNAAADWVKDRRAAEILEVLQTRARYETDPLHDVVAALLSRSWWN
jgi:hypothetical protein